MPDKTGATTDATAAAQQTTLPKGLEKFAGDDGKVDVAKLGEGYLNLEKQSTQTSQKLAEVERTMTIISAGMGGSGTGDAGRDVDAGRSEVDDTEPLTRADARPVVQGFLELAHPEITWDYEKNTFKDEEFMTGFKAFTQGLPLNVKQAIARGDYTNLDFALKQFKALRKKAAAPGAAQSGSTIRPNFAEGGSPAAQTGGKTYSRAELRELMLKKPDEYARIADSELNKAYSEGRVKE